MDVQVIGETESIYKPKKLTLPQYTLKEVHQHSDISSCWIVISDCVYDVTEFLDSHPGGMDIVMEHAGTDATAAFKDKGHSAIADERLKEYLIGQLVQSERLEQKT